jgi:hypothetical protein
VGRTEVRCGNTAAFSGNFTRVWFTVDDIRHETRISTEVARQVLEQLSQAEFLECQLCTSLKEG